MINKKLNKNKKDTFILSGIRCSVKNGDKIVALVDNGILSKYQKIILTYYNGNFYTKNRDKIKSINIGNWKYYL